ncbi:uncharacterized protein LOC118503969 [Anopheles stephensi]|uniref:uncharacterized protein LOC118503969 n=1 Tax=Anopheles stephensi TaxID=30069 RepID=UPI0016588BCE|nr:uncharacterized protein LOC118503969 [Anopheles stephensi]
MTLSKKGEKNRSPLNHTCFEQYAASRCCYNNTLSFAVPNFANFTILDKPALMLLRPVAAWELDDLSARLSIPVRTIVWTQKQQQQQNAGHGNLITGWITYTYVTMQGCFPGRDTRRRALDIGDLDLKKK